MQVGARENIEIRQMFSFIRRLRGAVRSRIYLAYLRLAYPGVRCHHSVRFRRGARLRSYDGGRIIIGAGTGIADFALIEARGGQLSIGNNCLIGYGSVVISAEDIAMGSGTMIAEYVTIRDQDHLHAGDAGLDAQGLITSPIRIAENVWLGAKVTVTRGVNIAAHVVVGANSVVTRSLDKRGVYAGSPARPIG